MNNLISSLIAFLIALVPVSFVQVTNPPTDQVTILFTGDIMLGRSVMGEAIDKKDHLYPFRNVSSFLSNADITFGNLENAIIKDCPRQYKGSFSFCTSPEIAQGLAYSGFDIVTLANNHSGNYGKEGFEQSKKYLSDMNIDYVGDNNLVIKEKNGIKFGFLGFDLVTSQINLDRNMGLIKASDPKVDVLIVSPHWGNEYQPIASSLQSTVSRQMVENGADIIIGHHPHWVQNFEEISSTLSDGRWARPVYYSLGNFVFDQMWSEETKKGLVVKITFDPPNGEAGTKLIKTEEFKTYTPKIGQPIIIDESPKE